MKGDVVKSKDTKELLKNSLIELAKKKPIDKITIKQVSENAGVTSQTFYNHFSDKYELLNNYLDRVLSEFSEAMATTDFILATPSTIANQQYIDNFRRSIDYVYDHRQIYRILWEASIDRPIYQEMEDIIRRNILGTIRRNSAKDQPITTYHDLYAELFASNLMTLVRWWLANDTTVSREDVEALMNSNMKNGLFSTFKYRI